MDENGEPSGVLKETAQGLIGKIVPQATAEETLKGIELAIDEAKKYGLTSVQGGADYDGDSALPKTFDENKLTARVAVWQNFETSVETLKKERDDFNALKLDPFAFETRNFERLC